MESPQSRLNDTFADKEDFSNWACHYRGSLTPIQPAAIQDGRLISIMVLTKRWPATRDDSLLFEAAVICFPETFSTS